MIWLFDVIWEFAAAVRRGDRSWKPFLASVAVLTVVGVVAAAFL